MYDEEVRTAIALIKQKVEFIEKNITTMSAGEIVKKRDLDDHTLQDRWLFGLLFVFLTAILIKVSFPHLGG